MDKPAINAGFLFDLDGVLIDSENAYSEIWTRIEREYPTGIEDFARKIKGTTLEKILSDNYPDASTRAKVEARLYELEGQMKYTPLPGAVELLSTLNRRGIPAVIVTSSNDKKMQHLWNDLPDFRQYFRKIVDGDMVTHSKPDPEGYLLGASLIDRKPEHCVVFEDSLQGVKAGHNSGAYVVGVAGTLRAETIAPYCVVVVDTLEGFDVEGLVKILENRK